MVLATTGKSILRGETENDGENFSRQRATIGPVFT
jgi:hypothetical protein